MKAVADSSPFIHLAFINHFALLLRYFHSLLILPEVYDEVVTHGQGQPGARELAEACETGFIQIVRLTDPLRSEQLRQSRHPLVSPVDAKVVALALEQQTVLLADDKGVRALARFQGVPTLGILSLLIRATREGIIPTLQPLLDQLIATGFHLRPHGRVYQEALHHAGERSS